MGFDNYDEEKIRRNRKRKTLVVCRNCHNKIHNGSLK